jgi:hypothetical protein
VNSGPKEMEFEREKWRDEVELRKEELAIKKREQDNKDGQLDLQRKAQTQSKWINPLVVAIIAAALAGVANVIVTAINGKLQRDNENARAEGQRRIEAQKAEAARILEMIKTGDRASAGTNLQFLIETGLVTDKDLAKRVEQYQQDHPQSGPVLPAATSPVLGKPGPGGPALGRYNADRSETTVSGVSGGAFMAVQLGTAFSSNIRGVGVIGGGPFGCAQGSASIAVANCVMMPLTPPDLQKPPDLQQLIGAADQLAASKDIDPLANLRRQKIYIFHGYKDRAVSRKVADLTVEFYRHYLGEQYGNIFYQQTIGVGNGLVTVDQGLPCDARDKPFIYACNYDQAGIILQYFYGTLRASAGGAARGKLLTFDQGRYTVLDPDAYSLGDTGYIYVPDSCARGERCRVHIALHGCQQDVSAIGDTYVRNAGYNEWAGNNNIIVLYPQSRALRNNPLACWDWWGFESKMYATHSGAQMSAVMAMLKVVTDGFKPQPLPITTKVTPPEDVKVIDTSATGVALTWRAVPGAARYRVYRSQGGSDSFTAVGDVSDPSFGEFQLMPATDYRWRVAALKDAVESAPSLIVAGRTRDMPDGR